MLGTGIVYSLELVELQNRRAVPGRVYTLELSVYPPLSQSKLNQLQESLLSHGIELLAPVSQVMTYPAIVKIKARAPREGVAVFAALPFWVLMTLAIGAVVTTGILGWRIGEALSKWLPAILIGGLGALFLYGAVVKKGR